MLTLNAWVSGGAVGFNRAKQPRWTGAATLSKACALMILTLVSQVRAQIGYTYDSLGRLQSVTDSSGTAAFYTYDAVGNILSVQRIAAGGIGVFGLQPSRGAATTTSLPGTVVTISGTGFSPTTSQNTVKFNGTTATVDSATATQLTTHVPLSATTGPVTVQVGSNIATSATFTVIPSYPATLSMLAGKPGETLTISATNFPTSDSTLVVYFNNSTAISPSSVSPTQVTVKVPFGFSSGPVSVATSSQVFRSAASFYPMPTNASEASTSVQTTANFNLNSTAARTTVSSSGGSALLQVPLTSGELNFTVNPQTAGGMDTATLHLYDPLGSLIKTLSVPVGTPTSLHLEATDVTVAGTYTLLIGGTSTGGFDLNVAGLSDGSNSLTLGTPLSFGPTGAGQYLKLPLTGVESGPVLLNFSNVTITNGGTVALRKFDGSTLAPLTSGTSSTPDVLNDGVTSARLRLEPSATAVVSGVLNAAGTQTRTVALGAAPTLYTAAFSTQWFRQKLTTSAGQAIGVSVSDVNQPGGTGYANVDVVTPSGTSSSTYSGSYLSTLIIPNPGTGASSVTVHPLSGATSNALNIQVGPSTLLTPSTTSTAITSATNAHAFMHFNVASADRLQVVLTNLTFGGATGQATVFNQRPDNFYSTISVGSGTNLILRADGSVATGIYAVAIDPPAGGLVSTRARLMTSNPTVQDNLPVSFSTSVANDPVIHNFSGAAGTPRSLIVKGLTFTGGTGNGKIYLFPPGGGASSLSLPSGLNWMFGNLSANGPYSVMVVPPTGGTTSGQLEITTGTLISKTTPLSFTTSAAGQGFTALYDGTAAEMLKLTLTNLAFTPSNSNPATVQIYRPDGPLLTSFTATSAAGGTVNVPALPSTGRYVISVFPPGGTTSGNLTLTAR